MPYLFILHDKKIILFEPYKNPLMLIPHKGIGEHSTFNACKTQGRAIFLHHPYQTQTLSLPP